MFSNPFPCLVRLHFGLNTMDRLDYSDLPDTLVHLCVALPEYHSWDGPGFRAIARVLCSGTLPNLTRLEMYTSSHVSPALDVA
ncbi:hypothetical protein JCM1840_007369 [Sporobolomyces johnsonii]